MLLEMVNKTQKKCCICEDCQVYWNLWFIFAHLICCLTVAGRKATIMYTWLYGYWWEVLKLCNWILILRIYFFSVNSSSQKRTHMHKNIQQKPPTKNSSHQFCQNIIQADIWHWTTRTLSYLHIKEISFTCTTRHTKLNSQRINVKSSTTKIHKIFPHYRHHHKHYHRHFIPFINFHHLYLLICMHKKRAETKTKDFHFRG